MKISLLRNVLAPAALTALIAVPSLMAQGGRGGQNLQADITPVPYERILLADSEPENWLTYSGNYMSQRHSQLTQITPENASELEIKWVFQSRSLEKHEVTPLVVDGVMYTIESPNTVVALDAGTGAVLWRYRYTNREGFRNPCCGNLSRGVAILNDKIYMATLDAMLIAIDARTGQEVWKTETADYRQAYSMTLAPLAIKDKILVGPGGGEHGIRGWLDAYDAETGERVWRFETIPGPGEPGGETWETPDSYLHGGAPIWVTGSYDPETNLAFFGTGNPGPDWNGDARLGDNLYSCSVIAVDLDTGELAWYYQFNPHNEFDWDATQVPVLADVEFEGEQRKAMLWANRNGVFYVLDRTTGEFLSGTSFVKTNWYTGFDEVGRPMIAPGTEPTPDGVLIYPGNQGGTNWYNPSFSPQTNLFYIPAWVNSSSTYVKGTEPPEFHEGGNFTGDFPRGGNNEEDIHSAIVAMNPTTGQQVWSYRLDAPSTEAGVMTTASNVLFSGGRDGDFYALNAQTGEELWKTNLGASVSAGPMTYAVNGEQMVTIQVGHTLFTFGLRD